MFDVELSAPSTLLRNSWAADRYCNTMKPTESLSVFSFFTIRLFFIIHWFTDLLTLCFGKLVKNKIENLCFFISSYPNILIMKRNIEHHKYSALIPQYTHKYL